jgi:uncharacterized membrane protein YqjE
MPEPTTTRQGDTDGAGIIAHFSAAIAGVLAYFQARTHLAAIESKEAAGHYLKVLIVICAGLLLAVFGYLFLCLGIVFAIARLFENPNAWIWVAVGVAIAHFGGGVICGLIAAQWLGTPMFSATIDEFKKDQEWLTKKTI